MIRLEPQDVHYIIYGIPELEGCECYHWGENLYLVEDKDEGRYLVNVESEKVRKISEPGKLVGFSDDEIDLEAIEKLPHSYNARLRLIEYGGISRWDNCRDGLITLCWTLYPDGRYFADEDGYGMEDNDEVNISAYIDTQCRVVVKFQDMEDSEKRKQLREEALKRLF